MTLQRVYDLRDVPKPVFAHIRDTLALGGKGLAAVQASESRATIVVEAESAEALDYIDSLVHKLQSAGSRGTRKVLGETSAAWLHAGDVDGELSRSSDVYELGAGLVGVRGAVLALCRFFEREFETLARAYGAEENRYPALLPMGVLEDVDYFAHFPQQVTFCSHLPEDLPLLERVAAAAQRQGGAVADGDLAGLEPPRHVLQPAVCLPCYAQRRDSVLPEGATIAVTMQNRVFRFEGANFRGLERLWDFTVRDLVFFGEYRRLVELREEVVQRCLALCRELDLEATVEVANDPFFLDTSRNKQVYQRLGAVKYELLLSLPQRGERLAASSFNLHRDFYTSVYNIHLADGRPAETACMGFGVERWAYGLLAQKGLAPASWAPRVTEYVRSLGAE